MTSKRDNWGSSMGFILAAAGSAVGLGNLWKFPYIAWENGGGSFVLIYLACILLVGLPVMLSEITIGRSAQLSTVPAFEFHAKGKTGGRFWSLAGWAGVATGGVILGYYCVIAGWSISSFVQCLNWSVNGYVQPADDAFSTFTANGGLQLGLAFMFSLITASIVLRGISGGIEKATRFLMPVLCVILVLLALNAFRLPGIGETFKFLFTVGPISGSGVLEALGHAFFTLSLGMGAMITYGSYMRREESIIKSAVAIAVFDTVLALIACIIMYSILFTFPDVKGAMSSPVGMLFITIPRLFYTEMAGGTFLAPVFFMLVGFAALSSTISMLEVVVALLVDRLGMKRKPATFTAAGGIFLLTVGCALSNGAVAFWTNFNPFGGADHGVLGFLNNTLLQNKTGFFNVLDHFASNWCLPVGGLLITFFMGWVIDQKLVEKELGLDRPERAIYFQVLRFVIRFVAPVLILIVIWGVNRAGGGH